MMLVTKATRGLLIHASSSVLRSASPRCARFALASARRELDRDSVQDAVAGERVEARLVGQEIRADAGVLAGDAQPGAGSVVAEAVREARDARHHLVAHDHPRLDLSHARAHAG